jgi:hypothetical protein
MSSETLDPEAVRECPFCDYTGTESSVEAHISGKSDRAHKGKVGKNFSEKIQKGEKAGAGSKLRSTVGKLNPFGGGADRDDQGADRDRSESSSASSSDQDEGSSDSSSGGEMDDLKMEMRRSMLEAIQEDPQLRRALASNLLEDMSSWIMDDGSQQPEANVEIDSIFELLAWDAYNNPEKMSRNVGVVSETVGESFAKGLTGQMGGGSSDGDGDAEPIDEQGHFEELEEDSFSLDDALDETEVSA